MTTNALANWYGSNRMLASHVGAELSGCKVVAVPFAGGMCEIPHLSARQILVNDLHRHVINLARVVADPVLGPTLYRKLRRFVFHPDTLTVAQERCLLREQTQTQTIDLFGGIDRAAVAAGATPEPDLLWATDYFVASWMRPGGRSGTKREFEGELPVRWNANGGGSAVRYFSAVGSLAAWRRTLRRCEFTTLDAIAFLDRLEDSADHGVYCDPPFPGPGDRYAHQLLAGQQSLADAVRRFGSARVVMRYYDVPLVRSLYPETAGWTWVRLTGRKQSNGTADEVLILNGPSVARGVA